MEPICIAIIVAGGSGKRFGNKVPKQYLNLNGKPLIRHCVETFLAHPEISSVLPVIRMEDQDRLREALAGLQFLEPIIGGLERQASVKNGLESLYTKHPKNVLIHDAARPFISLELITKVLNNLQVSGAVVPGLKISDTVKQHDGKHIISTLDRKQLISIQTPQGFRYSDILKAHRDVANLGYTDDAAVAEANDVKVTFVDGDPKNIKITNPDDLTKKINNMNNWEYRVGSGFDVHRFGSGDHVTLCGLQIPHDYGLIGHSDADAPIHALTDALLGAISHGDIGDHFPPSSEKWKNVSSDIFLTHAVNCVHKLNGKIINVDLTIICETPRITKYRKSMISIIAKILKISPARVSIKATTTEKLGFTGRNEGVAAQATATVATPFKDK